MKTALIILGACFIVLCVASGAVLIGAFHSQRDLREANRKMGANLRTAQTTTDVLLAEKQEMAQQLSAFRELTENLQSRVTDHETASALEAESQGKAPVVAPYQAQAYLGQKPLGWVWIVPQNLRKDTNTQRYVYEPVVWLDEGLRKQFVTHHTNVVEREVESRTYVNNAYYSDPYLYGYSYPTYPIPRPPPGSNCPPVHTPPIRPSPAPLPIQPTPQPFNPGNGTVTAQRLGTPAGAIKTRAVP